MKTAEMRTSCSTAEFTRLHDVNMPFAADRAQLANLAVLHYTQKFTFYRSVIVQNFRTLG